MADRYLITGGVSVNWNSTGSWSATDGGATGASFPVAGDKVFLTASSGAGTLTVNVSSACADFNQTGYTGTLAGSSTLAISANLKLAGTITYTGAITFNATTTGFTITSNGKALSSNVTFNGVGGGWTLADNFVTNSTSSITLTNGTFNDGGFSVTTGLLVSNNSNVRTFVKSGDWTITGEGSAVINFTTITNLTWTVNTTKRWTFTNSGSAASFVNFNTLSNVGSIYVTSGTRNLDLSFAPNCTDLNFTGFTGTLVGQSATLTGNLTFGTGMSVIDGSNPFSMVATSGTKTITSNGVTLNRPVTINCAGATTQLADALNIGAKTLTLTAGAFNDGGFNVTAASLNAGGTGVRSFTKTGTWYLTGTASVVSISFVTNLTWSSTGSWILTNASASARTISFNNLIAGDLFVTAGSGTLNTGQSNCTYGNIDFTGFTGDWNAGQHFITGNLTLGAGMTMSSIVNTLSFSSTSGTQNITSNGVVMNRDININCVGGAVSLVDDWNIGGRGIILTNGTFTTNDKNVTARYFKSVSLFTRAINLGASLFSIDGDNTTALDGNCWNTPSTSTGLTLSAGTSIIKFTSTSVNPKVVVLGEHQYNTVWFAGNGIGQNRIGIGSAGNGRMSELKIDSAPKNISFGGDSGSGDRVYTIDTLTGFTGSAGNLITISGTTPTLLYKLKKNGAVFEGDYLSVTDSIGTDGMKWFAGKHSVNGGNNKGWAFDTPVGATQMMLG